MMGGFTIPLKLPALCLLLAASKNLVFGLAVSGPACGYGYDHCPSGYECIKNPTYSYGSPQYYCQTIGYTSTPYPPGYTTPASSSDSYSQTHSLYSSEPVYTPTPSYKPPVYSSTYSSYSSEPSKYAGGQSSYRSSKRSDYSTPSYYPSGYPSGYPSDYSTPSYQPSGYPSDYSTPSYYPSGHSSDYSTSGYGHAYPSPTTIVYPKDPPIYYPSGSSSKGIYSIPLPSGYPDYPTGCSCVCPPKDPRDLKNTYSKPESKYSTDSKNSYAPGEHYPTDSGAPYTPGTPLPTDSVTLYTSGNPYPTDSKFSYTSGNPYPTDSKNSYTSGNPYLTDSKNSYTPGNPYPTDSETIYTSRQPYPTDSKNSYSPGKPYPTDSETLHTSGQPYPTDSKNSYAPGEHYPTDAETLYTSRQPYPTDPRNSYTTGAPYPTDSKNSYTPGKPYPTDSKNSYTPGKPYPTGSNTPYTTGKPTDPSKQNSTFTPVIGAQPKCVERRSIDVLQKDHEDIFNMLTLALDSLQKRSETNDLSYYQLSGIHGFPYVPWQYPHQNPDPQTGYCTHSSGIFTTWHRPYVVLLEQALQEEAVAIAKQFTGNDAEKYQSAAEDVRIPYWDWAADSTGSQLPPIVTQTSVSVVKPGSSNPVDIPNPWYNYRRPDVSTATVRSTSANSDLSLSFAPRKLSANSLFGISTYNEFSTALENIHNNIHVTVGGDMAFVDYSAFDPIFWLHHCNVDRLTAMYQASHPGVYLTPKPRSPTFALHLPGTDDLSTPLYPFRHPNANEWTSDDVKTADSIFKYGYSYPEVPQGLSEGELKDFVTKKSNELYGPKKDISFDGVQSGAQEPTARREWTANIVCDSEEIPGSQKILLYLGNYKQNQTQNYQKDDLAGTAAVFSGQGAKNTPNRYLNISVPLTPALVDKNYGLRPQDVVPKLVDQLHWVVQQVGAESSSNISVSSFKSLKISISTNVADYPEDDTKLPIKSGSETYYAPTADKVGGLKPGEQAPVKGPAINGTVTSV